MAYPFYPDINSAAQSSSNGNQRYDPAQNIMVPQLVAGLGDTAFTQTGFLQSPIEIHVSPPHYYSNHHHSLHPLPAAINYKQATDVSHRMSFPIYPEFQAGEKSLAVVDQTSAKSLRKRAFSKRSRTGCLTCRERRIKCGECRPICKNCERSKRNCIFPAADQLKQKRQKRKRSKQPRSKEKSVTIPAFANKQCAKSSPDRLYSEISSVTTSANSTFSSKDQFSDNQKNFQTLKPQNEFSEHTFVLPPINQVSKTNIPPHNNMPTPFQYHIHHPTATSASYNHNSSNLLSGNRLPLSVDKSVYQFKNHLSHVINHANLQAAPALHTLHNSAMFSNNHLLPNNNYKRGLTGSTFSSFTFSNIGPLTIPTTPISTNLPNQVLCTPDKDTKLTNITNDTSNNNSRVISLIIATISMVAVIAMVFASSEVQPLQCCNKHLFCLNE